MTSREDYQSVFESVRTHDPDRHLTALMAPRRVRGALMALYAFNTELARIPTLVSEPALGEIRLQWWRDVVSQMGTVAPSGAPVAAALGLAVVAHNLPKPLLTGMIDARSADLDDGGFPDLEALKAYLYKSEGAVFALSAFISGIDDTGVNRAANAAGVACGLTNLIRLLARDIAAGRIMLPLSMLDAQDIQLEQVLAGTCSAELEPVLAELATEARAARDAALEHIAKLDPAARFAFAPLVLVEPYLISFERPDHNALKHIAGINPLTRFWRLWRAS